jgi:hypothetical protein
MSEGFGEPVRRRPIQKGGLLANGQIPLAKIGDTIAIYEASIVKYELTNLKSIPNFAF